MGRILIADDHDSLRRGLAQRLPKRGMTSRKLQRQRRHRKAARRLLRCGRQRPEDGRQHRSRGAEDCQAAAPVVRGDPDDRVRLGLHGRRGDQVGRVRLRAEAVRDRGDGGQDREGARNAPDAAPDRLPPPRPGRHLRFRAHHRQAAAPSRRCSESSARSPRATPPCSSAARPDRQGADRRRIHHNSHRAARNFVR